MNKNKSVPPWFAYKFIVWLNRKFDSIQRKIMPTPMRVMKTLGGHCSAQVIYTGIKLGIYDAMLQKPKTIEELSHELHLNEVALTRLIRALCAMEMIYKNQDNTFRLSKTGEALTEQGKLKYQAVMMGSEWYEGFSRLHKSVVSGKKELNGKFNGGFFEYLKTDPELARNFNASMDNLTGECIPAILAEYDFSGANHIVDVGGGNGLFLSAILKKHIQVKGVLFDLHEVICPTIRERLETNFGDRFEFSPGDFFDTIPEGGSHYILKFILHDWSDEKALDILKNCRKAMGLGTKLILIEFLIEEEEKNMMRIYLDLLMLTMFDGKERTVSQFDGMLNNAGFKFNKVLQTRSFANIIEAVAI